MNGVHDLGGMHGFGPVVREANEPVFHADWERQVFRLSLSMFRRRPFNIDEFRHSIERMAPAEYLNTTYYEHWLDGIERLLVEKGVVTRDEIETAKRRLENGQQISDGAVQSLAKSEAAISDPANSMAAVPGLRSDHSYPPRFHRSDRIVARNLNPEGHTRLPRYVRGKRGTIREDWGVFAFPDTHAHGRGTHPQHCYAVEFGARELWGAGHPASDSVRIDLWEEYLEPDSTAAAESRMGGSSAKLRAGAHRTKKTAASAVKTASAKNHRAARAVGKRRSRATKKAIKPKRKSR